MVNVIAGWLITAVVALLTSGFFAFIMYHTGHAGPLVLAALAAFLLIRSELVFKKKVKEEKAENSILEIKQFNVNVAISESKLNTTQTLKSIKQVTGDTLRSLLDENPAMVRKSISELENLKRQNEKFDSKVIKLVRKMDKGNLDTGRLYIMVFDLMQDLYQSAQLVNEIIATHIINHHNPPKKRYAEVLSELDKEINAYLNLVIERIETGKSNVVELKDRHTRIIASINKSLDNLVSDIQKDEIGNRQGMLMTRILLELRDIVNCGDKLHELYLNHEILSAKN